MTDRIVEIAARNNALWCDAVCTAHGAPGCFRPTAWLTRHGAPPFYPDLVTLGDPVADQYEEVATLIASPGTGGRAVKDSFAALDLAPLGFTVLFEAQWIAAPASGCAEPDPSLTWHWATTAADVGAWERAWAAGAGALPTFAGRLAPSADIRFLLALDGGRPVCGGILNRGAGVVGLSNVFVTATDPGRAWNGLVRAGTIAFPGRPLVGYEHGDALGAALQAGFEPLGPLRVWTRT